MPAAFIHQLLHPAEPLQSDAEYLPDEKVEQIKEQMRRHYDALLVFAGLFSAVVATFIGITLPSLSPDLSVVQSGYSNETNALLRFIAEGDTEGNTNTTIHRIIPPSYVAPSSKSPPVAILANWMLLFSLCSTLLAAFIAITFKNLLDTITIKINKSNYLVIMFFGVGRTLSLELPDHVLFGAITAFFIGLVAYLWEVNTLSACTVLVFMTIVVSVSTVGLLVRLHSYLREISTVMRTRRSVGHNRV